MSAAGASVDFFVGWAVDFGLAEWAVGWLCPGFFGAGSGCGDGGYDFGDYVSGAADGDVVSDSEVFAGYFCFVVECGLGDGGSADEYGF